jgi:hypothetical protein
MFELQQTGGPTVVGLPMTELAAVGWTTEFACETTRASFDGGESPALLAINCPEADEGDWVVVASDGVVVTVARLFDRAGPRMSEVLLDPRVLDETEIAAYAVRR